ncbi:ParB N-terminal domain-containing protein [Butyrivibrio sp. VCD2006]|uniref:ParB N-terminal domain-containing protein n=1 Tax=Butyrivibrio sp. VCD2006 TaxID=1280664 RepID=UPI000415F989|nr:ParB N-terminal domain-containing protein [Butyrivibrio sp. VCD2006]
MTNEDIQKRVASDVAKYKGVAFPLKASTFLRLMKKRIKPKKLHPNPDDEFSMPNIGPNYKIISDYEYKIRNPQPIDDYDTHFKYDPIVVEKMYPDGYMILNGHHRWCAAMKSNLRYVCIEIVNLPHEQDIEKMIENGQNTRRVSLDLDEVVFAQSDDIPEKSLPFPVNAFFKERLRAGIPALFDYLTNNGFDIWVYTSKYYSMEHLTRLFNYYHVKVNGMITGTGRAEANLKQKQEHFKNRIAEKYKYTLSIDRDSIIQVFGKNDGFNEYELKLDDSNWSSEVMRITSEIIKNES